LLTFSALLLFGASLTIGSLHIVEAVVVSPELETVADAQLTPTDPANESALAIVRAIPASVLHVPQDPSIRTSVTTVRQSLPRSAPPADTPDGKESTPPAAAIFAEAHTAETEGIETPVESVPPHAPPPSTPLQVPDAKRVVPWTAAADAGVALGQRSKEGGLATARFFSRFGKRIADSF